MRSFILTTTAALTLFAITSEAQAITTHAAANGIAAFDADGTVALADVRWDNMKSIDSRPFKYGLLKDGTRIIAVDPTDASVLTRINPEVGQWLDDRSGKSVFVLNPDVTEKDLNAWPITEWANFIATKKEVAERMKAVAVAPAVH